MLRDGFVRQGIKTMLNLREKDIDFARSELHRDDILDKDWRGKADELGSHYRKIWEGVGVRAVKKSSAFGRLSKMTTTFYKQIRLGTNYDKKSPEWKAATDAHETVHVHQWRRWGRNRFRSRYIFWPRWRWSIEMQGYTESIRALVCLGASDELIHEFIQSRPGSLKSGYALGILNQDQMSTETLRILTQAWNDHKKRVPFD